jgi:mitochondrial fission protein ELM1
VTGDCKLEEPITIVVSVEKAGHINQCIAFCEQMGWPVAETLLVPGPSRMNSRRKNLVLRFRRWLRLRWLTMRRRRHGRLRIVASGISAERLVASYRSLYGDRLYAIYLGSPRWQEQIFDFAIASHHAVLPGRTVSSTCYPGAERVAWMPGVFVRALPSSSNGQYQSTIVVLIGGINKAFQLRADMIIDQLQKLRSAITIPAAQTFVAFSRRTPPQLEQELRAGLGAEGVRFVDRYDRQGFRVAVASASHFVVTPDSITMVCESFATGKPVSILDLPVFNRDSSTFRFVAEIRSFPADRAESILKDSARAALSAVAVDYKLWSEE